MCHDAHIVSGYGPSHVVKGSSIDRLSTVSRRHVVQQVQRGYIKLGTDNWAEWQILIKQLLVLEGCWSVVDPNAADSSTGGTRSDKEQEGVVKAGRKSGRWL